MRRWCCRRRRPTSCWRTSPPRRSTTSCSSGLATTPSTRRRATRCAPTSGTRSAAATSRFRTRFRSSSTRGAAAPIRGGHRVAARRRLGAIDLFATLPEESRLALSRTAQEHIFAAGEAIVRQGEAGSSMFVVLSGRVRVVLEPSGQEVAVIEPGGFFGEMSMLTGDPRTATVRAVERRARAGDSRRAVPRSRARAARPDRAHQQRGRRAPRRARQRALGGRGSVDVSRGAAIAAAADSAVSQTPLTQNLVIWRSGDLVI